MRKIRVYVDTSVFGGTEDEEFAEASLRYLPIEIHSPMEMSDGDEIQNL